MPLSIYLFFLIELVVVSYIDFKKGKISNNWSYLHLAFAVLFLFIFPSSYELGLELIKFPLLFFFGGFVMFALGIMGGGDAKYLATLFLCVPISLHDQAFEYLLYATVLVGGTLFVINLLKNFQSFILFLRMKDRNFIKGVFGKRFSYAPVILLGWLILGWNLFKDIV
ncbi:prepilin peptidase [Halobacteriovorax sp. GB3]|uniref:prepilin peptidase n=1 Tax=Halobacteriovorax sp. GB3 TaxID=2719615 RepID=UPI00235E6262|nr:prepilin peptidase [Halobacteriovorax sp. GB3]MDD0854558.1 prepilin peptidase [Halobacteriovorax sp. GB3]